MKKKLAIFLYVFWGVALTLILTFGTAVARKVLLKSKEIITELIYDYDIEDVIIHNENEVFIVGKIHNLDYEVIASRDKNPGLIFKSLDPDYISVNSGGGFTGKRTDEEKTSGRIEITSKIDPKFKKIITLNFEKKYPENMNFSIVEKSYGSNPKEITLGLPIYLGISIPTDQIYSEKDYEVIYDEEVFEEIEPNYLRAIKEVESTDISIVLGNGTTFTKTFKVVNGTEMTDYDEIKIFDSTVKEFVNIDGYKFRHNQIKYLYFFKDNKKVLTDFDIIVDDENVVVNPAGGITFKDIGTYELKIKFPNGHSDIITCVVENEMKFPVINNLNYDNKGNLNLYNKERYVFPLTFDKNVTYKKLTLEYDEEIISAACDGSNIVITPKEVGQTSLKIIYTDGIQYYDMEININITVEKALLSYINKNLGNIISKVVGHMGCFAILGLFTLNMFRFIKFKNKFLRFIVFSCGGGIFACITEFIQFFLPARDCNPVDVVIDMTGFYIGTLFILLIVFLFSKKKKKEIQIEI